MITIPEETEAFNKQAAKDWETILLNRAKELCPGRVSSPVVQLAQQMSFIHIGRFYTTVRIIHLDELGPKFVLRLVIRLWYKDGHKTHFPSRRTIFQSGSLKTHNQGQFVQTDKASCARLYTRDAQPDELQMFAQVRPDG